MTMPPDLNATMAASQSARQAQDLLAKKQALEAVQHNISGGDAGAAKRKDQKLREACQGFEEIFLNKIWSQMRKSIPKDGYLQSREGEHYQQMFDKELVKKMTSAGGMGLGEMLYDHLKQASQRVSKATSISPGPTPLPLAAQDRFRLAQQLLGQDGQVVAGPKAAGESAADSQGGHAAGKHASSASVVVAGPEAASGAAPVALAQVAYAPYTDPGAEAPLVGPGITPIPTPRIEGVESKSAPSEMGAGQGALPDAIPEMTLQDPASPGAATAMLDPDQPYDGREATPLDMAAMTQHAQAGSIPEAQRDSSAEDDFSTALPHGAQAGNQSTPADNDTLQQVAALGESIAQQAQQVQESSPAGQASAASLPQQHVAAPAQSATQPATQAASAQAAASAAATQPAQKVAAKAYGAVEHASASQAGGTSLPPLTDPVSGGQITSGFGWRQDPFTGQRAWHAGQDIAAKQGDPIGAAWDGQVVFAGESGEYGNIVVMEHSGGWRTFYGHAHEIIVEPGQTIKAGEQIATIGQTGRATGPHLHFELRQGGLAWDPAQVKAHLLAKAASGKNSGDTG